MFICSVLAEIRRTFIVFAFHFPLFIFHYQIFTIAQFLTEFNKFIFNPVAALKAGSQPSGQMTSVSQPGI
ncbi:MAG: hypothetical protein DRI57_05620 [Deltaproteobacteria bacterium]|nr:MAG: hypothetical protein DRI57_05620 [Deltaproteobacteria bacterium]